MSCVRGTTLTFFSTYLSPLKRKACAAKLDFWMGFFFKKPSFKIAIAGRTVGHWASSQLYLLVNLF